MPSIAHQAKYRESVVKYSYKYGVNKAISQYHESKSTIYNWRKAYKEGGNNQKALEGKSRRPHSHSNAHTDQEITLIKNLRRRNPNIGLQDLWLKARDRGYTRTMQGLSKLLERLNCATSPKSIPSPTCKKKGSYKAYKQPGDCIQIDVKEVPKECIGDNLKEQYGIDKIYQYTAIDVVTRLRIVEGYLEQNTYNSRDFLLKAISFYKAHGIEVKLVQTDNGPVFTKRFISKKKDDLTLFELKLKQLNIRYKRIKPHTPEHNGIVERSHGEDQRKFYSEVIRLNKPFTDMNNFNKRLKAHQKRYNNRGMRPLSYLSPLETLKVFLWLKNQ